MAGFLTPRPLGAGHHHRCHRCHYQNNNDSNRHLDIDNNSNNNQRRNGLGACVREKGVEGHRAGDLYDRGQKHQLSHIIIIIMVIMIIVIVTIIISRPWPAFGQPVLDITIITI